MIPGPGSPPNPESVLLTPTTAIDQGPEWHGLSRAARLARLHAHDEALDALLRARLVGHRIERLSGVRAWLVRLRESETRESVRAALSGVAVDVASNIDFHALAASFEARGSAARE